MHFVHRSAFPGHVLCSWVSIPRACTLFMGQHSQGMYFVHGSVYAGHALCSWVSIPRACAWFMGQHMQGMYFVHVLVFLGHVLCSWVSVLRDCVLHISVCIVSRVYKYHCLVNGSLSYGNVLCTYTLCSTPANIPRACTLFMG